MWELKNIESIYTTSIGVFIGLITILHYDWSWIDDFIIKRPWDKIFNLDNTNFILDILDNKGIFDNNIIINIIKPLLLGRDLDENITLKELYEYSNIDLHIFTTNINHKTYFEKVDLSHKSHPDLSLIQAMTMSGAIPIIFKAICTDNKCYIDGGLINNFPLNDCLNNTGCNENEVLAFRSDFKYQPAIITDESSTLEYLSHLLSNTSNMIIRYNMDNQKEINNILYCSFIEEDNNNNNNNIWINILKEIETRIRIIHRGENIAKEFIKKISLNKDDPTP